MRRIEVGGNFGEFLCSRCYVLCFAIMFYVSKSFSGMSSHKHKHNITRQKLCVYVLCYVYDKNISVKTHYYGHDSSRDDSDPSRFDPSISSSQSCIQSTPIRTHQEQKTHEPLTIQSLDPH